MIKNWEIKRWQERYIDNMEMLIIGDAGWYDKKHDFANDEVLETEIRMLRNCILWKYNTENFGLDKAKKENSYKRNEGMDRFFSFTDDVKKTGVSYERLVKENLKDKCILSNAWKPEKLYTILTYDLDFLSDFPRGYHYYYYQNLGIGHVSSGGNHRMFVQSIRNLDSEAEIDVLDDKKMLEEFRTDGSYFYKKDDPSINVPLGDERLALLITLVQLKLGIIKDLEQYMSETRAIRDLQTFLYKTEEDKARQAKPVLETSSGLETKSDLETLPELTNSPEQKLRNERADQLGYKQEKTVQIAKERFWRRFAKAWKVGVKTFRNS